MKLQNSLFPELNKRLGHAMAITIIRSKNPPNRNLGFASEFAKAAAEIRSQSKVDTPKNGNKMKCTKCGKTAKNCYQPIGPLCSTCETKACTPSEVAKFLLFFMCIGLIFLGVVCMMKAAT